ncbi:hypothetical protein RSAG8_05230, partial [Rhizoctonia solani AG-8 WAC10335]
MNKDHIAITVFEATRVAKYEPGPSVLADLQKRYNRALSRAALLIQDSFKISKNIPPTSSARMIHDTLQAILGLITEDDLHSGGGIGQDLYTYDAEIVIHVAQDAEYNMPRTISNWPAMRTGLLASVIALWGPGAEGLQYSKEVETVALSLVSKIGPDSMKHWSTRYGQTAWPNFTHNPSPNRPTRPDVPENPLTESIILQLLDIVNFSMLFLDRPDMYQLAEVALESLTCKAGTQDGQIILYKILIDQPERLIDWINALRSYSPATGHPGVEDTSTNWLGMHFTKLLATQDSDRKTICGSLLEHLLQQDDCGSEQLISIMKMMGVPRIESQSAVIHTERLLDNIIKHVNTIADSGSHYLPLLEAFTKKEGFGCLAEIGRITHVLAAQATFDIVIRLAGLEKWIEPNVIYQFLQAVHIACNFTPQNWARISNSFIPAAIRHLQHLDPSLESFADPNTIHTIENTLSRLKAETQYMTVEAHRDEAKANLIKLAASVQSRVRKGGQPPSFPVINTTPNAWAATLQAQRSRRENEGGRNDDALSMEELRLQSARNSIHMSGARI